MPFPRRGRTTAAGCAAFLVKPFLPIDLAEAMRDVLFGDGPAGPPIGD